MPGSKGKNKTFFFFNWESGRQIAGPSAAQALVPPAALRTGNFSGMTAAIIDPATRQPFPGNVIPASRIRSVRAKFLDQFVPPPNINEPGINYRGPAVRGAHQSGPICRAHRPYVSRLATRCPAVTSTTSRRTTPSRLSVRHPRKSGLARRMRASPKCIFSRRRSSTKSAPDGTGSSSTNSSERRTTRIRYRQHHRHSGRLQGSAQLRCRPTFTAGYTLPTVRSIGPRDRLNQLWQVHRQHFDRRWVPTT